VLLGVELRAATESLLDFALDLLGRLRLDLKKLVTPLTPLSALTRSTTFVAGARNGCWRTWPIAMNYVKKICRKEKKHRPIVNTAIKILQSNNISCAAVTFHGMDGHIARSRVSASVCN
jgi:hypothetical protein